MVFEEIVIHQPTGLVYMACSTQSSRMHWLPTDNRLNATGKSNQDYVAVFNPATEKVTVLKTIGYKFGRGLSVHGMDVVASLERPEDLLLYMVNHRAPFAPKLAEVEGQDSVIEVFRTRPGMEEIHYVATFKDPVISTPNDIVAGDEEMSFYFTNDHGFVRNGWVSSERIISPTLFPFSPCAILTVSLFFCRHDGSFWIRGLV